MRYFSAIEAMQKRENRRNCEPSNGKAVSKAVAERSSKSKDQRAKNVDGDKRRTHCKGLRTELDKNKKIRLNTEEKTLFYLK